MTDQEVAKAKLHREMKLLCLDIQDEDAGVWDRNGTYGFTESHYVMVDADVWEDWQMRIEQILRDDK